MAAEPIDELSDQTTRNAIDLLERLRREVVASIVSAPEPYSSSLRPLLREVDTLLAQYRNEMSRLMGQAVEQAAGLGDASVLADVTAAGIEVPLTYVGVSPELIRVSAEYTADLVQGLSDDARARIARDIRLGAAGGTSTTDLIAQIGRNLKDKSTFATIAARAEAITRTEVSRVYSTAYHEQGAELHERYKGMRKTWVHAGFGLHSRENHIRVASVTAETPIPFDERFELGGGITAMFPHDPSLPAGEVVHCFLPGTLVQGTFTLGMRSHYRGKAIEIVTHSGRRLSVTPNHGIATTHGFVPARLIEPGQQLMAYMGHVDLVLGHEDQHNEPALIEQIFNTGALSGLMKRVGITADDFHGDAVGIDGDVDVVLLRRELTFDLVASGHRDTSDAILKREHMRHALIAGNSASSLALQWFSVPTPTGPSPLHLTFDESGISLDSLPFEPLRIGPAANIDASRYERSGEAITRDADFARELLHGYTGLIALDVVCEVREFDFDGHVYDLQSPYGWIISNGIVSSNCRCRMKLVAPEPEDVVVEPEQPAAAPTVSAPRVPRFKTVAEARAWAEQNITGRVGMDGATLPQLQSIIDGMSDVLVPHDLKIADLDWKADRKARALAQYKSDMRVANDVPGSIVFQKTYVKSKDHGAKAHAIFMDNRTRELARLERIINDANRPEPLKDIARARLPVIERLERWSVGSTADDALLSTAAHEAGHALYRQRSLKDAWDTNLSVQNVTQLDAAGIGEYALSSHSELFAEVVAMIVVGERSKIPANILRAFDDTIGGL